MRYYIYDKWIKPKRKILKLHFLFTKLFHSTILINEFKWVIFIFENYLCHISIKIRIVFQLKISFLAIANCSINSFWLFIDLLIVNLIWSLSNQNEDPNCYEDLSIWFADIKNYSDNCLIDLDNCLTYLNCVKCNVCLFHFRKHCHFHMSNV